MSPAGILYSFRRCPYAIRARLALAEPGVAEQVEVREVALRAKPPELFEASAKGTVPVLLRANETTLDESLAILLWALAQNPARQGQEQTLTTGAPAALIAECDGPFKQHLDGFRYDPSGQMEHQRACLEILRGWSQTLEAITYADQADQPTAACLEPLGWAVLPFVRQYRLTDPESFAQEPGLEALKRWLAAFEAGPDLARVMAPPWAWRQPWRSPRWLYHLALEAEWQEARRQGVYARSTRGLGLAEVGFLHASFSHQVEATWRRFYSDGPELRLLVIDPARLEAAGLPLRVEPAPGSGELFPHLYGPLPVEAVLLAERFTPEGEPPLP